NLQEQESLGQDPVFLREKESNNHSLWYVLIAVLLLGLLGWYGYTAGWFGGEKTDNMTTSPNNDNVFQQDSVEGQTLAPINNVTVTTGESFPVQKTLVLRGDLPNGCTYLNDPQVIRDGNTFYVNLTTRVEGDVCTEALVPYERSIPLDVVGLPAGTYTVVINGKQITFDLEQDNTIDMSVGVEK
ncbi:MAG: hypothetical protein ACPGTS_02275, partial [Minisyncoccia bacterium]